MTVAELLQQARGLTPEEQKQLAHDLWVQADGPYENEAVVEAAWAAEINTRFAAILDGSDPGLSDAEMHQRFGL
jgi:hypothetical protein